VADTGNQVSDQGLAPGAESINLMDIFARVREADEAQNPAEDAPNDSQDGPADEAGELPDSADDAAGDDQELEAPEASDEPADEAPDEEPDTAEEKPAEDTPKPADPRDEEIARLKALVADVQAQNNEFSSLFTQHVTAQAATKAKPEREQIPEEAVRLALFGGDEEAWKGLPPKTRADAQKVAKDYAEREARYALNPALRYQDIREQVLNDVLGQLEPVIQEYHNQRAAKVVETHVGKITDPADKKRLGEILATVPGSKSRDWDDRARALEIAGKLLDAEKKQASIAKAEQKLTAKERQQQANKAAASRQKRGKAAPPPGNQRRAPRLEEGESLADFADRLLKQERGE
jgi:hypothetical protein